ncbi:M13 family metallopeptidase [Rhodopseudomonas palustris]|nr:M13 family metallopeptidase [Rhodopseudomonas palustris]
MMRSEGAEGRGFNDLEFIMRRLAFVLIVISPIVTLTAPARAGDKPVLGNWGIETQTISATVRPGDDFYRYVNEGWLKTAAPPPGMAYANSFVDAYQRTQGQLQKLIDGILVSTPAPGSDEAKIAALYRSYIDVAGRNQRGLSPIKSDLDSIWAIKTHEDAARLQGQPFFKSPIDIGVVTDDKKPERYVIGAMQAGLGLPSREYYLTAGEPFDGHRAAYLAYVADIFKRVGVADGGDRAKAILAFETRLAEAQWTAAEQRDPVKSYRLLSIAELQAYAPAFPWQIYLEAAGFSRPTELVLTTDTAIQKSAEIFKATDIETIKSYLAFHLVDDFAPNLTEDLDRASFAFNSTRLHGVPDQEALEKRAQTFVTSTFGEIFGRAYAKAYFPENYRAKMDRMIANIRAAFHKRLDANPWMDEATRKAAIVKLEAIVKHVGYPDRWRDWSSVAFDPTDLVGNRRKAEAFARADAIAKLGEKRREWQWSYPATDINAGYSPQMNSITFPAGILQPPFFDPNADDAVNYGAIGAVIGHELGHAFDDQGSQSDATGALRNWWTDVSRAEFSKRTAVLVQQFNGYSPLPGMRVNGELTLGENIGDLGGITIAHEAYRMLVDQEHGGKAPVIDGFTGDQRFFLSWAQVWRDFTTPDQARQNLLSDAHSPSEFRVNGALRNVDAWYAAFGVKDDDKLYLPQDSRVRIW